MRCLALAVVVAATAIGCQRGLEDGGPPAPPLASEVALRAHMRQSYGVVGAVAQLVVRGDLDAARWLARRVARAPEVAELSGWAAARTVRIRAEELVAAPSLDEAARRVARLGDACADCHAASGAAPRLALAPSAPVDDGTVAARMARHRWATDRLWEAVIADAEPAWLAGLDVLAAAPLPWRDATGDRENLARRLVELADGARRDPTDHVARARAYGELLVTCAACHATIAPGTPGADGGTP